MGKRTAAGAGVAQPGYGDTGDPELTLRQAEDAVCAVRNTTEQRDFRPFLDVSGRYPQGRPWRQTC